MDSGPAPSGASRNDDGEVAASLTGILYTPPHGMDRRRHRAGGAAAWRILCHCRAPDVRPWPPSRPGARRFRFADAALAAARQQRPCGVAGPPPLGTRAPPPPKHAPSRAAPAPVPPPALLAAPPCPSLAARLGRRAAPTSSLS